MKRSPNVGGTVARLLGFNPTPLALEGFAPVMNK
jgi:hypothetical protein